MKPFLNMSFPISSKLVLWCLAACSGSWLANAEPNAQELESKLTALSAEEAEAKAETKVIEAVIKEREAELTRMKLMAETLDKQLAALAGPTSASPQVSSDLLKKREALLASASDRVAVLQGEEGPLGIAFFAAQEDSTRIFTSAALVSKNRQISVVGMDGKTIPTGAGLSCPAGVDLVCLHPEASGLPRFELASSNDLPKVGDQVVVLAVDPGTRKLSGTGGSIRGIGPDVLELDASLVADMNGAPVLSLDSGKVVGIVTPQVEGVESVWAVGTRHQEARCFAARVDRIGKWQTVDLERFAKEAAYISRINNENHMAWLAYMLLEYGKGGYPAFKPRYPVPKSEDERNQNQTKYSKDRINHLRLIQSVKEEAKLHESHPQIQRAHAWLKGGLSDSKSIFRRMVEELKVTKPIGDKFTWYHSRQYQHALDLRREGIRAMNDSVERVGR